MRIYRKSRRLLIDIDGVAAAHADSICSWVQETYRVSAKYDDVVSWDHDFGPITFTQAVEACYPNDEFILKINVTPGFLEFFSSVKYYMNVCFASSRKYGREATYRWIENHFGEHEVIFTESKSNVQLDYLIDDSLTECTNVARKEKVAFLIERPWNDNEDTRKEVALFRNVYYVSTFNEIEKYLRTFSSS